MKVWAALIAMCLVTITTANVITMGLSQSTRVINATANYTISMQRTLDANGATITPSQLTTSAIVTIYMSGFNLSLASCPSNQTCSIVGTTVSITGLFNLNAGLTSLQLVLNNIINPPYSNTQINISTAISSGGAVVDQASTSTSFTPSTFTSIVATFAPGNVTYNSNLTLTLIPSIMMGDGSRVNITIPRYWKNSKKNTSSNIPAGVTCSVGCNLTSMVSSFVVTLNNISAPSGSTITFIIGGVVSPPTTENADTLSLISYDTNGYQLDLGTTMVAATLPNYFSLSTLEAGPLNKPYNLTFKLQTTNIFATNDTLTIVLPPQTSLTSTSSVSLSNSLVTSLASQLIMPDTIQIINNTLNFANPADMTITLTNLSGISSTKQTGNLKVSIYRNGFIYNYGSNPISATSDVLNFVITTTSIVAAANATYTLTATLSNSIPVGGTFVVTFPDLISLRNCSSAVSANTSCSINNGKITFTLLSALGQTTVVVLVGVRNPVSSTGMALSISTYDSHGYLMDAGTANMFAVRQASLPSSTITCSLSSSVVYDTANYTFTIDLTNYQLSVGYGVITLPSSLSFVNIINSQCAVNGQPLCNLSSTTIKFPVLETVQLYTLSVGQIRNPQSTLPFTFAFVVTDTNGNVYYNTTSAYYSANTPLTIASAQTNNNCTNEAIANYSLAFTIPNGVTTNGAVFKAFVAGVQLQPTSNSFSNPLVLQLSNQPSLKPWELAIKVSTSDGYDMFNSSLTVTNCQASLLAVTGQISGLPEDNTVVSVSVASSNGADTLIVNLPTEYSTTGLVCVPISNLTCTVLTNQSLKLVPLTASSALNFQLTNISNPLSSGYFTFQTFIGGYLASLNNNVLNYQAPCQSPCRSCMSNNTTACAGCFKTIPTVYPILDPLHNLCVSACPTGYYNSANLCTTCPAECSQCQAATNCTVCSGSFNLFQGKCLTDCPDLYYPSSGVCLGCNSPCLTCVSSTSCKSCTTGYSLLGTQCLQQCPNTTVSTTQKCLPCTSPCQTCQASLTNCTSCYSGNYLYNGTCVANCPSGFVAVGVSCEPCFGCLTCITSSSSCTSCNSSTLLYNFTCRSDCPISYYASTNDSSCIKCPSQCGSCISSSNCSTCVSPYNLHGTSCLSNCPPATMPYQLQCIDCILGCAQCTSLSTCDNCSSGYMLYHSICVTSCPNHTYLANGTTTCLNCPSQCASCNPLCQSCISGYLLYNGTCRLTCPSTTTQKGTSCQDCTSLYPYCSSCTSLACLTCTASFLYFNGSCLAACPVSTINLNNICTACHTGCINCFASTNNCSSCQAGYLLYVQANSCVLSCPYPSIPNAAVTACISCNPECASCVSLTNCSACSTGYSLYNATCLSTCPLAMYSLNSVCQSCSSGCLMCNTSGCQQCSPSMYSANNACYSQCPGDLPYAYNTKCNKCSQNCTSCTSSGCFACDSPLLIMGINCVAACPQNTTLQDSIRCVTIKNDTNNNNSSNSTTPTPPVVTTTGVQFVPFTALMLIALLIVVISKFQYGTTFMFGGMSALIGVLCMLSWIVVAALNIVAASIGVSLFLMLAAVAVHFIINIIFLIKNSLMLRKDEAYQSWKDRRMVNKVCSGFTSSIQVISFKFYLLQFSQLFGAHCLRARLDALSKFSFYDTMMIIDLVSNILAIAASAAGVYFNVDAKGTIFFLCVDCIVVSLVDMLLGLATKKRKGIFDEDTGSQSEIEQLEEGRSKDGKASVTMQKLLSEFHEQPSIANLKDGHETPSVEHEIGRGRPNKVCQEGDQSDSPVVIDSNAKSVVNKNVFEQNSEKDSESDEFRVDDNADGTECAAPQQFGKIHQGKESSAQDTQEEKNGNGEGVGLDQISEYSEREIRLGIQKYIDITLQGKKSEQDGGVTTSNDHFREQHAKQGTADNLRVEKDEERNSNGEIRGHEQGYLTEGGQRITQQNQEDLHPEVITEENDPKLLEQAKRKNNDLTDPPQTSQLQQPEKHSAQTKQDQSDQPSRLQQESSVAINANPNEQAPEILKRSNTEFRDSQIHRPSAKVNKQQPQSNDRYESEVYSSKKQTTEEQQIAVPAHIEQTINDADIQGPLVFQDRVLDGLVTPNRSSKVLKDNSSKVLQNSRSSKLQQQSSKNPSIRNSRTLDQLNLKTLQKSQLEGVDSRSEGQSDDERLETGKDKRKDNKRDRYSRPIISKYPPGSESFQGEFTPSAGYRLQSSESESGEKTDQVNELEKGSRQGRKKFPSRRLKSNSLKHSSAATLEPEIEHEPNQIPNKAYLKESPRLAPFKFRKSRRQGPALGNQTLQVERQKTQSSESHQQAQEEFLPVVIDLYHKYIKNDSRQEAVPKQMLPTTKSRQLVSGQSHRTSPPRRLFSSKPRSREKPPTLTSRDNVELMLQRIQTSHRKEQKMRELEQVYLRSMKK